MRQFVQGLLVTAAGVFSGRGKAGVHTRTLDEDDPDAAIHDRYKGIRGGGELYIDATYDTKGRALLYGSNGILFARGHFGPKSRDTRAYFGDERGGGLPLPKSLRMLRYPLDAEINRKWDYGKPLNEQPPYFGEPLVDVTVPVASRIPDEALDRIRQYQGSLKLKLRLTPETILVGWEVRNGKSYPYPRDAQGDRIITDADLMIGGDFCEAQVYNEKINGKWQLIRRKGWQIDPKTGQKIETDF